MKKFLLLSLGIALLGAGCDMAGTTPKPSPGPVACTMEAKQCPDGSYVGRSGPNCEFAACPGKPAPTPTPAPKPPTY